MSESVVLDPTEVSTDRTPIDITCWIDADGADWGDAAVAPYMSESRFGEVPVDYRVPSRTVQIPLTLRQQGGTTMSQIRASLQQKVGVIQREGGWLRRVTETGGTVFADVTDATLHATSWAGVQSRGSLDIGATLNLTCLPDFYGNEVTLSDHSTTTATELVFTETGIEGDYPARMRMVIDNDQAATQNGLFYGFRARNYAGTATSRIAWEAETMGGYSGWPRPAIAGASGGTVVRGTAASSYVNIVGGTFTHKGAYRMFARCYSATSGTAVWNVRWSYAADMMNYSYNDAVSMYGGTLFRILDLGGMSIQEAPLGTHRYKGFIQAKRSVGSTSKNFSVDKVWFVPADEAIGVVKGTTTLPASRSAELRTEGYFRSRDGTSYQERPVYGDLPRLPVPAQGTAGTIEVIVKASRGTIGDIATTAGSDAGIDDISARIYYRPCWLFVDDT